MPPPGCVGACTCRQFIPGVHRKLGPCVVCGHRFWQHDEANIIDGRYELDETCSIPGCPCVDYTPACICGHAETMHRHWEWALVVSTLLPTGCVEGSVQWKRRGPDRGLHIDSIACPCKRFEPDVQAPLPGPPDAPEAAFAIGRLALALGRVNRLTRHEDGVRPETDTDHTVMVGWLAGELAPPNLSADRIAAFALAHDAVEAIAGDVQTLRIDAEGLAAKRRAEDEARATLRARLGWRSWLVQTIEAYERQTEPEARFVRLVDKIVPKLTHALNGGAAVGEIGMGLDELRAAHARQLVELAALGAEFPRAFALLKDAMRAAELVTERRTCAS